MQPRPIAGSRRRLCGPELLLGVARGAVELFIEQQDVAVGVLVPRMGKPLALAVTLGRGLRTRGGPPPLVSDRTDAFDTAELELELAAAPAAEVEQDQPIWDPDDGDFS
jgi:hypothetical protein